MSLLFDDWYTYIDDDGVTPYYYNSVSQQTTWKKPEQGQNPPTIPATVPKQVVEVKVVPQVPIVEKLPEKLPEVIPVEKTIENKDVKEVVKPKPSNTHNAIKEML